MHLSFSSPLPHTHLLLGVCEAAPQCGDGVVQAVSLALCLLSPVLALLRTPPQPRTLPVQLPDLCASVRSGKGARRKGERKRVKG